jgi:hypothetical protein
MVNVKCIALFLFVAVVALVSCEQNIEIEGSPSEIAELENLIGKT